MVVMVQVVFVLSILLLKMTTALKVFNHVLQSSLLSTLDVSLTNTFGSDHYLFDRNEVPRGAAEMAVNSILQALDDQSRFVELWWRSNWISLDAHQDIDEKLAREQGSDCKEKYHYPENGHVLYLDTGNSALEGSTIIFKDKEGESYTCGDVHRFEEAVACPPLPGRLLRFGGEEYHAVVRPALSYFEPHCFELFLNSRQKEPPEYRRSVLLFNTWKERPLVEQRVPIDGETDGVAPGPWPVSMKEVTVAKLGSASKHKGRRMKVGLLGDARRRGLNKSLFLELQAHVSDEDLDRIQSTRDPVSWPISAP